MLLQSGFFPSEVLDGQSDTGMGSALNGSAVSFFALVKTQQGQQALKTKSEFIDYIENYQQRFPKMVEAYRVASKFYYGLGQVDTAILHLKAGLQTDPSWHQGYIELARYTALNDADDEVVEVYKQGIKHSDKQHQLRLLLACPAGED